MSRTNALGLLIVCVAVVLGAWREFLFVNLNYQIDFLQHERPFSYAHSRFQAAVAGMPHETLSALKWGLAGVFILLMLVAGIALARVLFGDHRYRMPITLGMLVIALLALLCHVLSGAVPALEGVSIALSHAIQYPVPLLFIYAGSWVGGLRARRPAISDHQ